MSLPPSRGKRETRNSQSQRDAMSKRDETFFAERKARDAANQEKTMRLKALRLAHEATLPPKPVKPVRAKKAKPA
jgi:hypothetical protein